jgi:hypothetical protein
MASQNQMTGMQGVYLAAAKLTEQNLIVSVTSRNARGADLLATDQKYKRAWSVQVKTSKGPVSNWPVGPDYKSEASPSHIYIFVILRGERLPDYYVVPSDIVAQGGITKRRANSTWHWFERRLAQQYRNKWDIFE